MLDYEMNRRYHETGGGSVLHNPTLHGGGGATVAYTRNNLAAGKFQVKISGPPSEARGTRKNAW